MLQKTFTWVGDNSEFCDIRARAMQGGYTHKGMHTHTYTSQTLSNGRNWEIMSIYKSHTLDSKFQFPLNFWGFLGEIVSSMARSGKVQDKPGISFTKSI